MVGGEERADRVIGVPEGGSSILRSRGRGRTGDPGSYSTPGGQAEAPSPGSVTEPRPPADPKPVSRSPSISHRDGDGPVPSPGSYSTPSGQAVTPVIAQVPGSDLAALGHSLKPGLTAEDGARHLHWRKMQDADRWSISLVMRPFQAMAASPPALLARCSRFRAFGISSGGYRKPDRYLQEH